MVSENVCIAQAESSILLKNPDPDARVVDATIPLCDGPVCGLRSDVGSPAH